MHKICIALTLLSVVVFGIYTQAINRSTTARKIFHQRVDGPYQSIAALETQTPAGELICTGVMLKSGYVLTAAHCVDRNHNGMIDYDEKILRATFTLDDGTAFVTTATAIAVSHARKLEDLDIAILTLERKPPIVGAELLTTEEYKAMMIGSEAIAMGMANGDKPQNITHGYITAKNDPHNHLASTSVYQGNSGGGLFVNKKLVGIISKCGIDRASIAMPIFERARIVGRIRVNYVRYLANMTKYVPTPAIREFLEKEGLTKMVFPPTPAIKPMPTPKFYYFFLLNAINALALFGVFKMSYWLES